MVDDLAARDQPTTRNNLPASPSCNIHQQLRLRFLICCKGPGLGGSGYSRGCFGIQACSCLRISICLGGVSRIKCLGPCVLYSVLECYSSRMYYSLLQSRHNQSEGQDICSTGHDHGYNKVLNSVSITNCKVERVFIDRTRQMVTADS